MATISIDTWAKWLNNHETVECAYGEIDFRWEILWKRRTSKVSNAILILEGAMHLHKFLVYIRNSSTFRDESDRDSKIDRSIFVDDIYMIMVF